MLDEIIKKQYEYFNVDNEEICNLEIENSKLINKIKEIDKRVGNDIDKLMGDLMTKYSEIYFTAGFKKGAKLVQEIQQLTLVKEV